jgi:hypothetical protein
MYYPKSQIKTNLYTNGDEFVYLSNNQPYTGYYYKTSTGQYFTGRTPDDIPSFELIQNLALAETTINRDKSNYSVIINTDLDNNSTYNNLISPPPLVLISPTYNAPVPTQQDYQIGEFRRYFCKKGNEILYLEIDKETYDKLIVKDPQYQFSLWQPFNLPWLLTGTQEQVYKVNRNVTILTSQRLQLPQFGRYLKDDYLKYYK